MVINLLKKCRLPLAILIIAAAIVSSLFRALTPWASQYKSKVEAHLSALVGEPVHIQTMETGWYWFDPVIKLKEVSISEGASKLIQLKKLFVGINVVDSLWHWQIQPGLLFIDDLHLTVSQKNKEWSIDGVDIGDTHFNHMDKTAYSTILAWILAQQKIIIKHLSLQVHLQNGQEISIRKINLTVAKNSNHYQIVGQAAINKLKPTEVRVVANLSIHAQDLQNTKGQIYLAFKNVKFSQWQLFFPIDEQIDPHAKGSLQAWIDVIGGRINTLQAEINLKHLAWPAFFGIQNLNIQHLKANLAWQMTKSGWQLTVDKLKMLLNGTPWPQNKLSITYNAEQKAYQIAVKHLLVASLLANLPERLYQENPLIKRMDPVGFLEDTRLQIRNNKPEGLLCRFSKLGWQMNDVFPGVDNLSGVINWQPSRGKFALDSEHLVIRLRDKPPIRLTMLNGELSWQKLNEKLNFNVSRLIAQNQDLLLHVRGNIEDFSKTKKGKIDLNGQLAATKAEQWMHYLPSGQLKEKLELWLQQNIKQIDSLVAEINLHGALEDFPFDDKPGEFLIRSHLQGVDLNFTTGWPLTRNLEAYLTFDKRSLNADIVHANLQGIRVDKANLRINDIGQDRETLLVHTKIDTETDKALSYVFETPLAKKLSSLKILKTTGQLGLDLRIEIPLYSENEDVLVLGDMDLTNNKVMVNHSLNQVNFNHVAGSLQFDQNGVLDSNLNALLLNYPVNILIQSIRSQKNPYTSVKIKGKTSIEVLNEKLQLPLFRLMNGDLSLESALTITDEPSDLDHLQIKTNLQGVAIDLPAPFGKVMNTKAPLTISIDFNPEKAVRFKLNYDNRLHGDLWFIGHDGELHFQKGNLTFGAGELSKQREGLQIVGSLPQFNLQEWQKKLAKIPSGTDNRLAEFVNFINVKLEKADIANHQYKNLQIKAEKTVQQSWLLSIKEPQIDAKLDYDPRFNLIKGQFEKLYVDKNLSTSSAESALQIKDLPNLDLQINDFRYNGYSLGHMSLHAQAGETEWQINHCQLKTADYILNAKAKWRQSGTINHSTVQANLDIKDLAKSLERFKLTPAVEAPDGSIQFQGEWLGRIDEFSLKKLTGDMYIQLKNGRITHLSPETEEKLGLGKLLSILSLQTIPRRLKLDFSDLAKDGYSFDVFAGHFNLEKGMLNTQDSYIDGPIAYASMRGNLDIDRQLYNLDLKVNPHITASLPIVATIAGGPIIGVATWVASKIINQGMQKISGYTYTISGPWKEPLVEQTKIYKKKKLA